jgi:hypothetical protein
MDRIEVIMQTFIDTATQKIWEFDDDVIISSVSGENFFESAHGYPLKTPATLQPYSVPTPTDAEQLLSAQTAKIGNLAMSCQNQIYAGFTSSALGTSHTYPAKDKDQPNLTASYAASFDPTNPAGWTTPFWVMDSTGTWSFTQHTAAQIQQAGRDGKAAILAALEKNSSLASQVMAVQLSASMTLTQALAAVAAIVW